MERAIEIINELMLELKKIENQQNYTEMEDRINSLYEAKTRIQNELKEC